MHIIKLLVFLVEAFKVLVKFENVTDHSILVNWATLKIGGVNVTYKIMFNDSVAINIRSPPYLINNLSDGEVHSVQVTLIVKRRDDRMTSVKSEVYYVRTGEW